MHALNLVRNLLIFALLKIIKSFITEKLIEILNKNSGIMKKIFLLSMAILCGSFAFAILPTPSLVAPTQSAINQDINVQLDWGTSTGATSYEYKLSINPSLTGALAISTGSNSYFYTSNLLFNTTYYWAVRAKSTTDSSNWTSTFQFTTHDIITQVSPSFASTGQDINVMLDWNVVNGISYYDVEMDTNSNFNSSLYQYIPISSSNSYYYTSNLLFATKYFWRVRSRSTTDTSSWSSTWNFTTHDNVSLVSPTSGTTSQDIDVMLDWNVVNGISNYYVDLDTNANFSSPLHQYITVSSSNSYYYTSNLLFNQKYFWRVKARDATDTTSWSATWNFTTHDNVTLVAPTNGSTSQTVDVMLDWNVVSGISNYYVDIDTNANFNSPLHQYITVTSSNSYYYTSNLLFNQKYFWRVKARDATDTTSWSATWNFTTHDNVTLVAPTNGSTSQTVDVMLDWNVVSGISNYYLDLDTNSNFDSPLHQYITVTSSNSYYYTSNLYFNTKYYWRIRARDAADTTSWSATWNFTTHDNITLVTPTNNAISQDVNVLLDWTAVSGNSNYFVDLDTNSNFSSPLHQYLTVISTNSSYNTSNLLFDTKYYWRVRARDAVDTTSWSAIWNFTTYNGKPVHEIGRAHV